MIAIPKESSAAVRCPAVLVAFVLLAAGVLALPGVALARSAGHYLTPPARALRFRVHGSHGFLIGVSQGSRRHFTVTVRRGPVTVEYAATGPRSLPADRLRGRIGHLGSFDVRFTPKGIARRTPPYGFCSGPRPRVQRGTVHGTIRFRGERGYTRVRTHWAKAELETAAPLRCNYGEPGHSKHPPRYTATFSAEGEGGGLSTYFEALRFAPSSPRHANRVAYEASVFESIGAIRVVRNVSLSAPAPTFALPTFSTAPENAVIEPPAPFAGSATFSRTPESTFAWAGNLAVRFPGRDPVPLAGPDFRLHYCALRSCVDQGSPSER